MPVAVRECGCRPTTWPAAFTARASLSRPPSVPRSTIPPVGVHENACTALSADRNLAPADDLAGGLTAAAWLSHATQRAEIDHPARRRPRERVHAVSALISLQPTTRSLAFTATAWLSRPPSVPRSTIPPAGVHENA